MSSAKPPTQDGNAVTVREHKFAKPSLCAVDFEDPILETTSLHIMPLVSNGAGGPLHSCIRLATPFQMAQDELTFNFEEAIYYNHNHFRDFRADPFAPDPYRDDNIFVRFPNGIAVSVLNSVPQRAAAFNDIDTMLLPQETAMKSQLNDNSRSYRTTVMSLTNFL